MKKRRRSSGVTAFVIKIGLICCVLLLLNAAFIQICCVVIRGIAPAIFADPRAIQAALFFGPILLIFFEFWVYDRRVDYVTRKRNAKLREETSFK